MTSVQGCPILADLQRLFADGTVAGLGESQLLERYLTRGDEAAFDAILRHHGPMVLGVCRRTLPDPHDVEDAFQATFLILVKEAGSIRDRDVLGTWLYRVAQRGAGPDRCPAATGSRVQRGGGESQDEFRRRARGIGRTPGHHR